MHSVDSQSLGGGNSIHRRRFTVGVLCALSVLSMRLSDLLVMLALVPHCTTQHTKPSPPGFHFR
jgi:hypothetical protein